MRWTTDPGSRTLDATGRLQLTQEGLVWFGAAILLGAISWWKSTNIVLILAYLMGVLLIINGAIARSNARRVRVNRDPTPPSYAGEDAVFRVNVTNVGLRPSTVSLEDQTGGEPTEWLVYRLDAGATTSFSTRRIFAKRGRYPTPVRVSSGFPLGLLRLDRLIVGTDVLVLPAAGVADPDGLRRWLHRHVGGSGLARRVLRRVTTDNADVRGVRPYRPGDPIRTIHWRSSARRGVMMVREYDAAPAPDLVLVVEPWLPPNPTASEREALETALSLTVTIARTWGHVCGTRVTMAIAGDPSSIRTTVSTDDGVREALTSLADVTGASEFPLLGPEAFERSLAQAARVVVSSRRNTPYAASLGNSTGRPFVAVSPNDHLPWYQAPSGRVG